MFFSVQGKNQRFHMLGIRNENLCFILLITIVIKVGKQSCCYHSKDVLF